MTSGFRFTVLVLSLSFFCGCGTTTTSEAPVSTQLGTNEPGIIEITDVKSFVNEDNIVQFRVNYKFTSGKPSKFYMCNFDFPGTDKKGLKPLDAWEMKPEGFIVAGIELGDAKAQEFTVKFEEADSPDRGYKANSNVFTGKLTRDDVKVPESKP